MESKGAKPGPFRRPRPSRARPRPSTAEEPGGGARGALAAPFVGGRGSEVRGTCLCAPAGPRGWEPETPPQRWRGRGGSGSASVGRQAGSWLPVPATALSSLRRGASRLAPRGSGGRGGGGGRGHRRWGPRPPMSALWVAPSGGHAPAALSAASALVAVVLVAVGWVGWVGWRGREGAGRRRGRAAQSQWGDRQTSGPTGQAGCQGGGKGGGLPHAFPAIPPLSRQPSPEPP